MITRCIALSLCLITSVAPAIAVWMTNGDRYTAKVQFRVAAAPESLLFDDRSASRHDDFDIYKHSQQLLVKSDYVLTTALRNEQVSRLPIVQKQVDPVPWLARNIDVAFPGNGEVLIISLTTDDPDASALLVAAVSKAYLDDVVNQDRTRQRVRFLELQNQLDRFKAELDAKRTQLRDLMRNLGPVDAQSLANEQQLAQDLWTAVRREMILARNEVTRLETKLEMKKRQLQQATEANNDASQSLASELDLERTIGSDPITSELQSKVRDIQKGIENLQTQEPTTENSEARKGAVGELAEITQRLEARREELKLELQRRVLAHLNAERATLETELATQSMLLQRFTADEAKCRTDVRDPGSASLMVEGLKREIDSLEDDVVSPFDKHLRELEIELSRPARVTRITRVKSDTPDSLTPDDKLTLQELVEAVKPGTPDPSCACRRPSPQR